MSKIYLENMEFHAFHGCLEHEQKLGNTFIVTLGFEMNTEHAELTDELDDTLNYQWIYDAVKQEMEIPSKLIEHLVRRIADSVFDKFNNINSLNVKLSKLNPPLGGKVEKVTIEYSKTR